MKFFPHSRIKKSHVRLQIPRRMPFAGTILVRQGQRVTPVQVLGRAKKEMEFHLLNASRALRVRPANIDQYLLVAEGDAIEKGMPLMRKTSLMGKNKVFGSPVNGVVHRITNGRLILKHKAKEVELRALVNGRVVEVIDGYGVVLETVGSLLQAVWATGEDSFGKLKMMGESGAEIIKPGMIDVKLRRLILVGGRVEDLAVLQEADASGVKGMILGSMPAHLCAAAATLSYPILLTEGVGDLPMAEPFYQHLAEADNQQTALLINDWRHGELPQIIVPSEITNAPEDMPTRPPMLENGILVRILSGENAGQIGEVIAIQHKLKPTPVGVREHGATVKLSDEDTTFVPYANLERLG